MSRLWSSWIAVVACTGLLAGCGEADQPAIGPTEGFVCATDGKSYSVEDAGRDAHEVRHRGRCDEPMHCDSSDDCFVGDRCVSGGEVFWCIPGPARCNCPGVFEPVCGGDGRNYINTCEAACAGLAIQHEGYCEEPPGQGCVRAGCSDHLCVEEGVDIASTCEWRPVYQCYQQATCERQLNGQCGFTPTAELVECLERHGEGLCRIDPRWQNGFEAECESPQVPGIVGVIAVEPQARMQLGQPFRARFELLEPPVFGDTYQGQGVLVCRGDEPRLQGTAEMTPLGSLEFDCRILGETHPGQCLQDGDCPPGHYCEQKPYPEPWPVDAADEELSIPYPELGVCVDLCVLIDCAPGHVCERGECVPTECPAQTHVRNFEGACVPKCYGPEQCGDEQRCNAIDVCLQDPACLACDVCVGWCVPPAGDCRVDGCESGWTCDYCRTGDAGAEWICLPPDAGVCEPLDACRPTGCNGEVCANQDVASPCVALPEFACYQELGLCEVQPWGECGWTNTPELDECLSQFDCRAEGCDEGEYCTFCWFSWECIPDGAVC